MSTDTAASDLHDLLSSIDREVTAELQQEQSRPAEIDPADTLKEIGRYICFHLAGRHLAIPLPLVLEVGELETLRSLPFLPAWVNGVTNIRGEIVSVVNLAAFLNISEKPAKRSRTFIIIHDSGIKTAVIVDRITGTRLLYAREGAVFRTDAEQSTLQEFITGSALFFSERTEKTLEIFDVKKLLAAIQL